MPKYTTSKIEAKKRMRDKRLNSLSRSNGFRVFKKLSVAFLIAYLSLVSVQQLELFVKGSKICASLDCVWVSLSSVIKVDNIEGFSIMTAAIVYLLESGQRKQQVEYEAWQIIDSATGINTSYARIKALKDLHQNGISFKGIDLSQANLQDIKLVDTDLRQANLKGAILIRANLSDSELQQINLQDAKLNLAILVSANLGFAKLGKANLIGANLTEANLSFTNLTGANLTGANLTGANLTGANLTGANLTRANLTGANLTRANLTRANLKYINLDEADLNYANLTGVDLSSLPIVDSKAENQPRINVGSRKRISWKNNKRRISIKNTKFNCTILKDANLQHTSISEADFSNAWLCNTIMTDGSIENKDCKQIEEFELQPRKLQ
jgi:uncharacterized protein YjbI with pentapeptide repeats